MEENGTREIHWSSQLEDLIAKEGEKCRGLAWLHQQAEAVSATRNNYIQLPVIVLSTLAGVGSTASSSLFEGYEKLSSIVIGLVSIGVGILNTLGGYFAFARKAEGHHIAYLHYSKLFSWISVELALPREERMPPQLMLKELRTAMERLAETTPLPPTFILQRFNHVFKDYKDVSKPHETNGLQKIIVYRNNPLHSRDESTPTAFGARDSANTL
jgi:hypothetical protein